MTIPKILFVIPPTKSMFGGEGNVPDHPHVGIAYLTAYLKQNKIKVSIFDQGLERDENKLISIIRRENPDIVGISIFSYCYDQAYKLIATIKKQFPNKSLILGGSHIAATQQAIIKETKADFAFVGEAEYSLLSFLKERGKPKPDYQNVPGLIWKNKGKIIENKSEKWIAELDKLPFPDYEAFDFEKYPCYTNKTLPLLTSRGCPYGCNYCSVRLSMGRGFRPRSPQNVINEIKYWYKKGFNSFDINDDCFTLDMERAKKICDLIIKNQLKIHFQLYNGIRVDRVDLELLKKLKKAGCTFIAYGCEAGNQKMLDIIQKGITLNQVKKAVEMTNQAGIKNAVNFIIGHVQETYEDAKDSIEFAKNLPANFVNFYNLVPYPGTQAYEWAVKYAKFLYPKESFLKQISYRDNVPIFETKEFTKEQREIIMKQGFNLYEQKVLTFRLGPVLGTIVYYLTRIKVLHDFYINLLTNNLIIRKIFIFLSSSSRK
jgi:anaerobic magnesium-protoporphyrin IX monomethyl ester cyclase